MKKADRIFGFAFGLIVVLLFFRILPVPKDDGITLYVSLALILSQLFRISAQSLFRMKHIYEPKYTRGRILVTEILLRFLGWFGNYHEAIKNKT